MAEPSDSLMPAYPSRRLRPGIGSRFPSLGLPHGAGTSMWKTPLAPKDGWSQVLPHRQWIVPPTLGVVQPEDSSGTQIRFVHGVLPVACPEGLGVCSDPLGMPSIAWPSVLPIRPPPWGGGTSPLAPVPGGYFTVTIPGGCHVPVPGGRIEGGSVFGQ